MGLALVAVPFVLAAQLFGTIEKPEAIGYGHFVRVVLLAFGMALNVLDVYLLLILSPLQGLEETPALLSIEFYYNLEISLFDIWFVFVIRLSLLFLSGS